MNATQLVSLLAILKLMVKQDSIEGFNLKMDLDPMFHFYYDGCGDVRYEFRLRKSQVTLEKLAMIFKVICYISEIYVTKKE